jgi:3-deoxy-D-manno-octulosonic acid (KDO) 8-phosphate synthase
MFMHIFFINQLKYLKKKMLIIILDKVCHIVKDTGSGIAGDSGNVFSYQILLHNPHSLKITSQMGSRLLFDLQQSRKLQQQKEEAQQMEFPLP